MPASTPAVDGYETSLRDHLTEYVWSNTLLPPLSYLLHSVPILLFGVAGNSAWHGYFLLNVVLDTAAILLVYFALARAAVPVAIRIVYSTAFALALIPFELWRANYPSDHYDHHTVALTAFMAYAVVRLAAKPDTRSAFIAGSACALLMLQSSAALYIAPLTLLAIGLSVWRHRMTSAWRFVSALTLLPAVTFAALSAQKRLEGGLGSARGGAALMMFVQEATDNDPVKVRNIAVDSGAPDWYLWCYDNASSMVPPGDPAYDLWLQLARAFGICMPPSGPAGVAGVPWPFSYEPLLERLRTFREDALVRIVEADQRDAYTRQYLLQGPSPELTPRWIRAYATVSMRVAMHFLRTEPRLYFENAWLLHDNLYWGQGPDFLACVADQLRTQEYPLRRLDVRRRSPPRC